jgi:arginine-tRNA-protein transferase
MALGFRRSGRVIYRPVCRGCTECHQLRVPVGEFIPTRSMRRVWRRNLEVRVVVGELDISDEKYELFERYLEAQHDDTMSRTYEAFCEFLYDSPTTTCEICYCLGRRLIGVSIVDVCPSGLSSVYMYFDPEYAVRSLGTFSAMWEIDYCRREGMAYYYLGFYVPGGRKMDYKSRFRPNEVLAGADYWLSFRV